MLSNEYLYGKGINVPSIDESVCNARVQLLKQHMLKLLEVGYLERDYQRITKVSQAIHFWNKLKKDESTD